MTILVTGGAGFIGTNFVRDWLDVSDEPVVILDSLSHSRDTANLEFARLVGRCHFIRGSIGDSELVERLLRTHRIRAIVNFAAETHVDRSISWPKAFFETNVMETLGLLEAVRAHLEQLNRAEHSKFRFLHVSTDEVYGTLDLGEPSFSETSPYHPNNPYAASKAAADHLIRAYERTYSFGAIITNCSNNFGPFQFPEKLIPLVIHNALNETHLPIYGDGLQVRDWLFVSDHCSALREVLRKGIPGESYNIGGDNQRTNLEVVRMICRLLDRVRPRSGGSSYVDLIVHVADRRGHDRRYAVDATKISKHLGWRPATEFEKGLELTVDWYLSNEVWLGRVADGEFQSWLDRQYG